MNTRETGLPDIQLLSEHMQIQCCGVWIDYPTPTCITECETCGSVFSIAKPK